MRRLLPIALLLGSLTASAAAQDAAPLVREDDSAKVSVTKRKAKKATDAEGEKTGEEKSQPKAEPTPDPETVIVAIVNNHSITRAQLDRRIKAKAGGMTSTEARAKAASVQAPANVIPIEGGNLQAAKLDAFVMEAHDEEVTIDALRKEEAAIIQDWQDQMMLADEARRHGFVISERELKDRLAAMEQDRSVDRKQVASLLDSLGMSRAEFEAYVSDAILVEKLLDRFVSVNYTDADLRSAWERSPGVFKTPTRYRVAQYAIALMGDETPQFLRQLKDDAEAVRDRLAKGQDPQKVFEEVNDVPMGVYGTVLTWTELNTTLHPEVQNVVKKLKPGETSKVISANVLRGGKAVPESFHVVKLLEVMPATGDTFETALPKVREGAQEGARKTILEMLQKSGTHRCIRRLGGISPSKLPKPGEIAGNQTPIDLKVRKDQPKSQS